MGKPTHAKTFGSKEICKCLEVLGFQANKQHGTSHKKYNLPKNIDVPQGVRPFVIVVMGRREFDPATASKILKNIQKLGFSIEEIMDGFN